jgi:hypothetical protein
MITTKGKDIVAKYLIGQTSAYASYLAVGCGATPLQTSYTFTSTDKTNYMAQQALTYEMFRVPILSKGYIYENGQNKIVFTAQLPTTDRYAITEIGVYPAQTNPTANINSYNIFNFSSDEIWTYGTSSSQTNILNNTTSNPLTSTTPFFTNVTNIGLNSTYQQERYEPLRSSYIGYYVPGDFSTGLSLSTGTPDTLPTFSSNYIQYQSNLDLSKYGANDKLKFAFSVINKTDASNPTTYPSSVKIIIQFLNNGFSEYATMQINQSVTASSRYFVAEEKISNFYKTSNFDFSQIKYVRIYSLVTDSTPSNYWFGFDGLRFENLTDTNPLYGLAAYTVIKNQDSNGMAVPVIKELNSSGLVQFKFAMDVV